MEFLDKFILQTTTTSQKTKDYAQQMVGGIEVFLYELNFKLNEYQK